MDEKGFVGVVVLFVFERSLEVLSHLLFAPPPISTLMSSRTKKGLLEVRLVCRHACPSPR